MYFILRMNRARYIFICNKAPIIDKNQAMIFLAWFLLYSNTTCQTRGVRKAYSDNMGILMRLNGMNSPSYTK